jgi:hypothetical protein
MDFWNDLQSAADAVRTGGTNQDEPEEIRHLPDHVKQHLMSQSNSENSNSSGGAINMDREPAFRKLPDHLKNNPYANLSREELVKLYEQMQKNPAAHQMPGMGMTPEMMNQTTKDGKPYIDPEGGCTIQPNPGFVIKSSDQNQQKVFVNMTSHELVDPPQEKHMPDSDQPAVRIPLSLGELREDFDKKGDPCRVLDVIWNPEAVKKGNDDMLYRHGLVELAFEYIKQKHNLILDLKYKAPKNLKYKGKTVQFQRIRATKAPKIEQLDSQNLSEEELGKMNASSYNKIKEEKLNVKQKRPNWKLYCVGNQLKDSLYDSEWW